MFSGSDMDTSPVPLSITMFPVVAPPRVRVCAFVVWRLPSPVKYVAMFPEFAEIEATGVPVEVEPALMNANLALSVDVAPRARSVVRFPGLRTSPVNCQ